MEPIDFRSKIAEWRTNEGLTQDELDEACGFRSGTVGRLERKLLKMTDEQFIRIVLFTNRDLLWVLAESCGSLYKRLVPLERNLSATLGKPASRDLPADPEFRNGLQDLLSGAQVVLTKVAKASDPRMWLSDLFLRAASTDAVNQRSKRVRKARPAR